MKKIVVLLFVIVAFSNCKTTTKDVSKKETINSVLVKRHLFALSSDEMQGRKAGTEGIEKAAKYIENEFKRIGLQTFDSLKTFRQTFSFTPKNSSEEITTSNIIGFLEGKSKKDEFVIISAHYDHLGIKKTAGVLDSIYNGANDDASGVTGVLTLAAHYKNIGSERSIVFVAFTAEEMGLLGSTFFGKTIDPIKFVAGINLEMIGKTPSFGPNTAWLTGFKRSDFGKIIQKNLEGTAYKLRPDPYTKFNLFFRSDNASLARLGVPSHTFSTTAIDVDKNYHQASDEAETLDINVITTTIKAIAKGTKSIIEGEDTPTRIVLKDN